MFSMFTTAQLHDGNMNNVTLSQIEAMTPNSVENSNQARYAKQTSQLFFRWVSKQHIFLLQNRKNKTPRQREQGKNSTQPTHNPMLEESGQSQILGMLFLDNSKKESPGLAWTQQ